MGRLDSMIIDAARIFRGTQAVLWRPGAERPIEKGHYQRVTFLGVRIDVWDGEQWRRVPNQNGFLSAPEKPAGWGGVICANQELPWRAI